MAVIYMTGFEAQQAVTDRITITGTASISTTQERTGAASFRSNPASGASGYFTADTGIGGVYTHFGLYIASLPSVTRVILGTGTSSVRLTSGGVLEYVNGTVQASTSALGTATWYWIGIRATASGTGVQLMQVDGVNAGGTGNSANVASTSTIGCRDTEASAIDIYIDDIIVDDTGFLAPSKVDMAFPISDNTVTGVTDNNGVATNIWQCLDNAPPIGVASANEAANPKAGMHFPASTTCDYTANLESYTTLGVASGDTVLAVQSVIRHGEDVATGTKNLQNVGAMSNPTQAGTGVVAGLDGGAHGAEVGLWVTRFGAILTSPSVTIGTSPTMRISRTSEARLACVDFMALDVAWTPTVVAADQVPYFNTMPPFLAQ